MPDGLGMLAPGTSGVAGLAAPPVPAVPSRAFPPCFGEPLPGFKATSSWFHFCTCSSPTLFFFIATQLSLPLRQPNKITLSTAAYVGVYNHPGFETCRWTLKAL
jgi:hypothetical protein